MVKRNGIITGTFVHLSPPDVPCPQVLLCLHHELYCVSSAVRGKPANHVGVCSTSMKKTVGTEAFICGLWRVNPSSNLEGSLSKLGNTHVSSLSFSVLAFSLTGWSWMNKIFIQQLGSTNNQRNINQCKIDAVVLISGSTKVLSICDTGF